MDHTVKDSLPLSASVIFANRFSLLKKNKKGGDEKKIKLLCHILTMESLKCVKNMLICSLSSHCTLLANSYKNISFRIHCTWLHCDFLSIKREKTWNQDVAAKIRRKHFLRDLQQFHNRYTKKKSFYKIKSRFFSLYRYSHTRRLIVSTYFFLFFSSNDCVHL